MRDELRRELGEQLVGAYLYGSSATGPYLVGQSDVDMLVVVRDGPARERVRSLLDAVRAVERPAAVKGLDLWVIPLDSTRRPCGEPEFVCWLLTAIDRELISRGAGDARLVLLYAMCRDHGAALTGPPPRRVFGPIDRRWLIDAMRVDLALVGAAGWYRVLNACRTLHYIERGVMCGKLTGAAWARSRVADQELIDAAVAWRRHGEGPAMPPERVEAFVEAIADRLPRASPPVRSGDAIVELADTGPPEPPDDGPFVSCVLVAPSREEHLVLAAKRFLAQDWPARELVVLRPPGSAGGDAIPRDSRIRVYGMASEETGLWRETALRHARGQIIAAWDAATWYADRRLTQQASELLSTPQSRVVAPNVFVYDLALEAPRLINDFELLERTTLAATREGWAAAGAPARLGERGGIAVVVDRGYGEQGEPANASEVRMLVGENLDVYAAAGRGAPALPARLPPVSCLMPTYNRRRFAERAIAFFLEQDYPDRELVVIDDGEEPIGDLVPRGEQIRYRRIETRMTIGAKRQLACRLADGDLLVQWDDDDWYGASRLRRQVAPLAAGGADISGILRGYLLDLKTMRFWKGEMPLHEGRVHALIIAGTLAYTREIWRATEGYPDRSIGEEVALLQAVIDTGGRVAPILSDGVYVCVRHHANSWRLPFDADQGPMGWTAVPQPQFFPDRDMDFYRSFAAVPAPA